MKKWTYFIPLVAAFAFVPDLAFAGNKELKGLLAVTSVAVLVGTVFTLLTGAALAFQVLLTITFPKVLGNALSIMDQNLKRLSFLGLINTAGMFFIFAGLASLKNPLTNLIALAMLVTFLAIYAVSMASSSSLIGGRVLANTRLADHSVARTAVGWLTLAFCLLIPIVGWLVFLYYAFAGLGSTMMAIFAGRPGETEGPGRDEEKGGQPQVDDDDDVPHNPFPGGLV